MIVPKSSKQGIPDRLARPPSGRPAVPHCPRSTFRDWAAERGFDRDLAEMALAHQVGSAVELAYRRSDLFERRRALMAAWSDFIAGREKGSVVPFAKARKK